MGTRVYPVCIFCSTLEETGSHLFFKCQFTKDIWSDILKWQKRFKAILEWELEWSWMQQNFRGEDPRKMILKNSLTMVVYGIWPERNRQTLQITSMHKEKLIH